MSVPLETASQAQSLPEVRAIYDAMHAVARRGVMAGLSHQMLYQACADAGIGVGAFDARIGRWLAGFEPESCAVAAGLITRAAAARSAVSPEGGAVLVPGDVATVLAALDDGVRWLQQTHRRGRISSYQALAGWLRGDQ